MAHKGTFCQGWDPWNCNQNIVCMDIFMSWNCPLDQGPNKDHFCDSQLSLSHALKWSLRCQGLPSLFWLSCLFSGQTPGWALLPSTLLQPPLPLPLYSPVLSFLWYCVGFQLLLDEPALKLGMALDRMTGLSHPKILWLNTKAGEASYCLCFQVTIPRDGFRRAAFSSSVQVTEQFQTDMCGEEAR